MRQTWPLSNGLSAIRFFMAVSVSELPTSARQIFHPTPMNGAMEKWSGGVMKTQYSVSPVHKKPGVPRQIVRPPASLKFFTFFTENASTQTHLEASSRHE